MRHLITGTAGFVGYHLANRLLSEGHQVLGVDGLTPYYDVKLKQDRTAKLKQFDNFSFVQQMLEETRATLHLFAQFKPEIVVHLAAQAGVRYSLENPRAYLDSNLIGSFGVLEACREHPPIHLMMSSTSSVYGASDQFPLTETGMTDRPLTFYAATKKSMEVMAHSYSHLWALPTTVFRFFSVYGPWGRPDMALFKFVQNILAGAAIDIYNQGKMERDFTYIDDLVESIVRLCDLPPAVREGGPGSAANPSSPVAPYRVVNIGGGNPVGLLQFIEEIETALGRTARRNYMEMQPGDVPRTEASTDYIESLIGYRPSTPVSYGVREFVKWYKEYYRT